MSRAGGRAQIPGRYLFPLNELRSLSTYEKTESIVSRDRILWGRLRNWRSNNWRAVGQPIFLSLVQYVVANFPNSISSQIYYFLEALHVCLGPISELRQTASDVGEHRLRLFFWKSARWYRIPTSDRMHGMIQTEARLFILWLLFRYACFPIWKYAAAKIHMHFLEDTFKETFFLFSHDARSLGTAPWCYHAYAIHGAPP